ncbi:non-hydrolyzing UDP-N-acetylglucosamine 2-epimerase [Natrialbaceae archaeon AArc-T1-2]|uniref:non-hydrolyzing UDP-N-acetylglucosamine 2-epimerase n=1 Tax=Natrialbaceae archaeon AArc-T1-2 TaxID=3053904 RepID=UPI00255A8594|nr:UDP-N-acetylglucosamine 2-epimerase (non-hydrolyzing) [Natrialbaceae archaeon AArc-T1-2]WIV67213.1 UDP-N-acetylglucosamine 2-epimerase (non-hydrolyzing) [Natrialbaceae archaeon AArc-T1-2]
MNVLSIVGARPQFVKAAAVSHRLRRHHEETLVHTGQHYDRELSEVFFEELSLPRPEYNLGVGSGSHASQTAAVMTRLEDVLEAERPDVVLVYGDTNSTLAGALVAAKTSSALAHVEAGLRSRDRTMPEEVNRILTDHCSDVLFAPSRSAERNLEREGITEDVFVPGDVMYDTLLQVRDRIESTDPGPLETSDDAGLGSVEVPRNYVLATVHRASNTDDPDRLRGIVDGLRRIPEPVVFPAHPRTVDALHEYGLWERATDGIDVVDPVGYLTFVRLVAGADCVATDSGGIQKEAFYLDTPCITLREHTEWTETVDAGWNRLVGTDADRIVTGLTEAADPPPKPELYGNGSAAERIVDRLGRKYE